ncbi:hypothetical protein [Celeribacter sp.]|uniref:hypothetical protein n=1 Tax=Celeribacter sp. TaxID=1890673 RepID=UPI003A909D61
MKFLVKAIHMAGFYRAGVLFPHEGRVCEKSEFTDLQWEVIAKDQNLRIEPLPGEAPETTDDELKALIVAAIATLPEDGFDDDGKPRLEEVAAALPDFEERVTEDLLASIWAGLSAKEDVVVNKEVAPPAPDSLEALKVLFPTVPAEDCLADGRPKVSALQALSMDGAEWLTAQLRDELWKEYQASLAPEAGE